MIVKYELPGMIEEVEKMTVPIILADLSIEHRINGQPHALQVE